MTAITTAEKDAIKDAAKEKTLKGPAAPDAAEPAELDALALEAAALDAEANPAAAALEQAAAAAQASAEQQWAALVYQLGSTASPIIAPNWNMQPQEWDALGNAWAPILAEYFPDTASLGPWPGAILTTALIVAPRIGSPLRAPEPRQAPAQVQDVAEGGGNG